MLLFEDLALVPILFLIGATGGAGASGLGRIAIEGTLVIAALSSYLLLPLGWLLFGIASFRAGVYPRILCVAIMIGGLIGFGAGLPPYGIPLGLAVAALGVWCLARPVRRPVETTERIAVRP